MPNHITNILLAPDAVLESLKGEESIVDFEVVTPRPDIISSESVDSRVEGLAELICGKVSLQPPRSDLIGGLKLSNIVRDLQKGGLSQLDDDRFESFVGLLRAFRATGFFTWYDWNIAHWGTKWNAYEAKAVDGGIEFETAWSAPHPIIAKLSDNFPEFEIRHKWADEDIGHNLGERVYKAGTFSDVAVADPVDFALKVTGRDRECYRQNPATGLWEFHDKEEASA